MVHFPTPPGRGPTVSGPVGPFAPAEILSRLGPVAEASAELRSLARERDPRLFFQALLSYAGRLERRGAQAESQAVLEIVAGGAEASIAERARTRLQALQGTGGFGARAEVLAGRFFREATEPAALFAMGGAGAIYRLSRFTTLARLSLRPAGALTRGFSSRALASSLAFSVEATSFPLLVRAANVGLGRSQQWSADQLGHEIAASFFALGGLKLAGAGATALTQRLGPGSAATLLGPVFRQGAMFGGILAGHRMEEWVGLRPSLDGATTAVDGLALLLQFNLAGRLSQRLFGERFQRWERELDRRGEILNSRPHSSFGDGFGPLAGPIPATAAVSAATRPASLQVGPMIAMMEGNKPGGGSNRPQAAPPSRMGIREPGDTNMIERQNRLEAERVLRELIPQGVRPGDLDRPRFVERLLNAFSIPAEAFDIQAFRRGYKIAQRHPERVGRLAFDFDEVTLHWAFGPRDLFRVMADGAESAYYHTPAQSLIYEPLPASEGQGMNRFQRIWFDGVQRLLPMAFRQHVQFHPGMRALQLGMRLGQSSNLIMVTVGPAGRLMRLANEDPALKMIYFGRLPMDDLSIGNIRGASNIYTREDIVQALRSVQEGNLRFPNNPLVESYVETLRRHPDSGNRLKHPALALLRGKRPYDALVDDSPFALEVLGDLPGFKVFQVPSARPARTKNFTLGSTEAYLARSANGYVDALADVLMQDQWQSGPVENRLAPANYPYQRFSIEMPWTKFGQGYVALGREAKALGRTLAASGAAIAPPSAEAGPLSLSESQTRAMVQRLYNEFEVLLDGRVGEVSIEAANTLMFKEMATASPENFQASLDTYFLPEEQAHLPQAARPLAERSEEYYSRVASLVAAKTAVCNLLGLDVAEHAREIRFRYGRPLLSGMAAHRLNGHSLLTTLSDAGEVGIGIALIESEPWSSGLVGIGVDLEGNQVRSSNPERYTMASAAFKAVLPAHVQREFNEQRIAELSVDAGGNYSLSGESARAARHIRGDVIPVDSALPIRGLSFQVGRATVGLAAIPALSGRGTAGFVPRPANFPYRVEEDGSFQLPRPGMTVAVLGDVQAVRTLDLVRKGHYVVHIERDPDMAELTEKLVQHFLNDRGPAIGTAADNSVIRADWYDTRANADIVEAYFPAHTEDFPTRGDPRRPQALREFLDLALNSKLVNGGSAFVVSEVQEHIQDLAQVVRDSTRLQLLDAQYHVHRSPIPGGFSSTFTKQRLHYLVYRKESSD